MSDDEIDKAVREAAEYEAQDKKRKEAIDARNDADSFVFQTQQALDQVGANLDAADKSEVENDMNAVKSFLDAHQNAEEMTEADVTELKSHPHRHRLQAYHPEWKHRWLHTHPGLMICSALCL